ncbi:MULTISPECIES: hypothetical protein [Mycobacteriaceae]|jgi:hypothetical protein|uniref:Uncharacterized protein n=2 Tax=Mycobacteriaceae TaxID=1762 RepID=A0A172UHU8_9MYCO|nr:MULTISPECIES: hypothetical protein [Mycolicibacterium]ANE78618.1 hypothetical protein A7U43_04035 [Mycobacterium adipatum]OKH77328.1 hypothetical protein EB73_00800 [Mycobacterium sp. SWH-M3]GJJ21192.1 hypothetical protein MTY414_48650 [Mycolicibacterium mageritense]QZT65877.1 hypothetical protein JN085_07765 [Mycolicibacterium austroafricanum]BCI53725.1 hypothetical protein NIIDNTM18_30030 [Mycolicibacterium litorale]
MSAVTTPVGALLTRSQIETWDRTHLEHAAARWRISASESEELFEQHRRNIAAPGGTDWEGTAKDAALDRVTQDTNVVRAAGDTVRAAADLAQAGADDLRAAQRAALEAIAEAEADGFRVGDDLSVTDTRRLDLSTIAARHTAAAEHTENIRWNTEQLVATDTLIGRRITAKATELDGITFVEENGGHDGTVQLVDSETRDRDARHPDGRERDPDGEYGRRVRDDGLFRRPEGGDSGGADWLDSDWAGRAILDRYLVGGGRDWTIQDNPEWSQYMMDHNGLARELDGQVRGQAQQSLNEYLAGHGAQRDYSAQFAATTQNGESITGYQYLNGTNDDAGGFRINGTTHVEPLSAGTYKVTVDGGYQWNDIIDANAQYATDTFKDRIAEIITLGQAHPYQIHIGWHSQTEFVLDQSGALVTAKGYPYQ